MVKRCDYCSKEHEVVVKKVKEKTIFKEVEFEFEPTYSYCETYDSLYENEEQLSENSKLLKDAYREKIGLLTSKDILGIRQKYKLSQKALAKALGWGELTITRYETYQVQDKIHNDVLKKIEVDPEWFLELLEESKDSLSKKQYLKTKTALLEIIYKERNGKIKEELEELYQPYGFAKVDIKEDKIIGIVNFFASYLDHLYTVKLMKLLWYTDNLFYKKYSKSITGMQYLAYTQGALPIAHTRVLELSGISYEKKNGGNRFVVGDDKSMDVFNENELEILNNVLKNYGYMKREEIVETMHKEKAYIETIPQTVIDYKYAEDIRC